MDTGAESIFRLLMLHNSLVLELSGGSGRRSSCTNTRRSQICSKVTWKKNELSSFCVRKCTYVKSDQERKKIGKQMMGEKWQASFINTIKKVKLKSDIEKYVFLRIILNRVERRIYCFSISVKKTRTSFFIYTRTYYMPVKTLSVKIRVK